MKKLIILVALTVFLKPIFPVIEYAVNYDYIAKVLCVNKDKPVMHCNGKCHLMKQLAKEAETEKPSAPNKKSGTQEFETLFFQESGSFEINQISIVTTSNAPIGYTNLYAYLDAHSVFHPPTLS